MNHPAAAALGSSPLTRGKPAAKRASMLIGGLIPAHAGKTSKSGGWGRIFRAHPRSRGENSISGLIVDRATGSSPLTRGKRFGGFGGVPGVGLIPAHAGKTPLPCRFRP